MKNKDLEIIVGKVRENFRSFGGGLANRQNPVSMALADRKPMFAAGVDIEDVVKFVEKELKKTKK